MKVLFKEKQRISLMSLAISLPIFILIVINLYRLSGDDVSIFRALSNNLGLLFLLVLVGLWVWFSAFSSLETTITEKSISLTFFPVLLSKRTILWDEVETAFVREYNPLQEFGGWGIFRVNLPIQRGLGNSRAINIKGNKGLQLVMKDGSRLLIGTQESEKINDTIRMNYF